MKKKIFLLLLALALTLGLLPPTSLAADSGMSYRRTQKVEIGGAFVTFTTYALKDPVTGYDTNYVKLRDLALALNGTSAKFDVQWDGAVNILSGRSYTKDGSENNTPWSGDRAYKDFAGKTRVNGVDVKLDAIVLTDDRGGDYTYYKLRDLGAAIGFGVDWDSASGCIALDTSQAQRRLEVPDIMGYFGLGTKYDTYSDGSLHCAQNVTLDTPDHKGALFNGFFDMMDRNGYKLEQVAEKENNSVDKYFKEFFFRYTGAGADKVKSMTYEGVEYDYYVCYSTWKNHVTGTNKDEIWNYTNISAMVADGLTVKDSGDRDSRWKVRVFDEARDVGKVAAATPTPAPTPAPTLAPTPEPLPDTTSSAAPTLIRRECSKCEGFGKLTCGYCHGYGQVSVNWGPAEVCPRCNGYGLYSKCEDCGGDGYLDPGDGGYSYADWDIPAGWVGRCPYCSGKGRFKCICGNGTRYSWNGVTGQMEYYPCSVLKCNGGWISCDGCGGDGRIDLTDPH